MNEPFCIDCIHRKYVPQIDMGRCMRPLLELPRSAYSTEEPPARSIPCNIERMEESTKRPDYLYKGDRYDGVCNWFDDTDHCGPDGKHFQRA